MDIVENELKKISLAAAYSFLNQNPEENLPRLLDWLDHYMSKDVLSKQRAFFRELAEKKDGNWYRLLVSLWTDLDDDMRRALFENIVINANALAAHTIRDNRARYQCNIPWIMTLSLGEGPEGLGFDDCDAIIMQAKALGTFMFTFAGEEPLRSKEALIALCNKNRDCEFMVFTDGALIDEDFVRQVLRVKNLVIALKTPDGRMGEGLRGQAALLRAHRVPFAAICSYDREDQQKFAQEAYFDDLIENGVKMVFLLSSLPDEEDIVYQKAKEYRKSKAILSIHFCKDRDMIGGCVAGGRYYCHINGRGDAEPCFFVHTSDTNVREKSLLEAYRAPLFLSYYGSCPACPAIH
jgi:hypothetical protein